MDSDRMAARAARHAAGRKANRFQIVLIALGLGVAAGVGGFLLTWDGDAGERLTGRLLMAGGVVVAIVGGVLAWRFRPTDDDRAALEAGSNRRDREQKQRRVSLFMIPGQSLIALALGLPAVGRIVAGEADFVDGWLALIVMLWAWVSVLLLQGWDGGSRKARKFLEDEWTRVVRASALSWGYVTLLAGVSIAYGVSLWRPQWTPLALAIILAVGAAVPALRFALLDRSADDA